MSLNDYGIINLNIQIMLKNILNLKGAQKLSKNEQITINGGGSSRCAEGFCAGKLDGTCCNHNKQSCIQGCCRGPQICHPQFAG